MESIHRMWKRCEFGKQKCWKIASVVGKFHQFVLEYGFWGILFDVGRLDTEWQLLWKI